MDRLDFFCRTSHTSIPLPLCGPVFDVFDAQKWPDAAHGVRCISSLGRHGMQDSCPGPGALMERRQVVFLVRRMDLVVVLPKADQHRIHV